MGPPSRLFVSLLVFLNLGRAIYWIQAERCLGPTFGPGGVDSCGRKQTRLLTDPERGFEEEKLIAADLQKP